MKYQSACCRDVKRTITIKIIGLIRESGGRFVKFEGGDWIDVGKEYAHEKTSHALRSAKDPNRPRPAKKPRKIQPYIPTPEEDAHFDKALETQRMIFQRLLESHKERAQKQEKEDPATGGAAAKLRRGTRKSFKATATDEECDSWIDELFQYMPPIPDETKSTSAPSGIVPSNCASGGNTLSSCW